MKILDCIKQINWNDTENKRIVQLLIADAKAYMERVEAHIYKGNEIRADAFMDFAEKQEAIQQLDRKRTEAHDKMLKSFASFLDILIKQSEFDKDDYALENRTQIADFIASIVFEIMDKNPDSMIEGDIRDSLVEKLHKGEISFEQIVEELNDLTNLY